MYQFARYKRKIRNTKHEIRNKHKYPNSKNPGNHKDLTTNLLWLLPIPPVQSPHVAIYFAVSDYFVLLTGFFQGTSPEIEVVKTPAALEIAGIEAYQFGGFHQFILTAVTI
jgi:hypothetical protein